VPSVRRATFGYLIDADGRGPPLLRKSWAMCLIPGHGAPCRFDRGGDLGAGDRAGRPRQADGDGAQHTAASAMPDGETPFFAPPSTRTTMITPSAGPHHATRDPRRQRLRGWRPRRERP
jgi:hypothetical protein